MTAPRPIVPNPGRPAPTQPRPGTPSPMHPDGPSRPPNRLWDDVSGERVWSTQLIDCGRAWGTALVGIARLLTRSPK